MDLDDDLDDSEADEESVMINHDPEWDSDEKIIKTKVLLIHYRACSQLPNVKNKESYNLKCIF